MQILLDIDVGVEGIDPHHFPNCGAKISIDLSVAVDLLFGTSGAKRRPAEAHALILFTQA